MNKIDGHKHFKLTVIFFLNVFPLYLTEFSIKWINEQQCNWSSFKWLIFQIEKFHWKNGLLLIDTLHKRITYIAETVLCFATWKKNNEKWHKIPDSAWEEIILKLNFFFIGIVLCHRLIDINAVKWNDIVKGMRHFIIKSVAC